MFEMFVYVCYRNPMKSMLTPTEDYEQVDMPHQPYTPRTRRPTQHDNVYVQPPPHHTQRMNQQQTPQPTRGPLHDMNQTIGNPSESRHRRQ